jgi:hypothetical protein
VTIPVGNPSSWQKNGVPRQVRTTEELGIPQSRAIKEVWVFSWYDLKGLLTEPSAQWSDSPLWKRVKSLMKTADALRMKDMKRCMWI